MSPPTHSLRVRAWCTAWPHCPFTPLLWTPQVLSGHEGPISSLCFNPVKSVLASASWDKTVRLWDMADSWRTTETLGLTSDGGCLGTGTRCSHGREAWSQDPWGPAGRVWVRVACVRRALTTLTSRLPPLCSESVLWSSQSPLGCDLRVPPPLGLSWPCVCPGPHLDPGASLAGRSLSESRVPLPIVRRLRALLLHTWLSWMEARAGLGRVRLLRGPRLLLGA